MEKTKTASLSGVYILDPRQDLVLTVNTFGPKTVLLESNLFYPLSVYLFLLYGNETWIITKDMGERLNTFATSCNRNMLTIKGLENVLKDRI